MIVELGYYTFPVVNLERGKKFYGELFGWQFDADAHAGYAHVNNSTLPMGLNVGEPARLSNLYFRVDDLAATLVRLRELGGSHDAPYESASGHSAVCRDDQDSEFSLWQAAPGL